MPITQRPDGTGNEVIKCMGYCNQKGQEKLYCGAGCRNIKKLPIQKQKIIKEIENKLYFIGNIDLRENYKNKIKKILDPNTYYWKKLKEIEKHL